MDNFNLKSSLITAIYFYATASVILFVWGFFTLDSPVNGFSTTTWIVSNIIAVGVMYYYGTLHFNKTENKASVTNGFLLGVTVIVVDVLLDLIFTNVFGSKTPENYHTNKFFFSLAILTILTSTYIGMSSSKDSKY